MRGITTTALLGGAIIMTIGVMGTFQKISDNDGALAIAGGILVAAAMISRTIADYKS